MSGTSPHTSPLALGGGFTLPGASMSVARMGYGAMQLAGPHVWGPPKDADAARAVLREAAQLGINHIDTSDFYGPFVTNQLIREALHPYPAGMVIVTKVGYLRGSDGSWNPALSGDELTSALHSNLRNLGLDAMDVVNLRVGDAQGPTEASIEMPLAVLTKLQGQGLIRHIGLSNISRQQFRQAQSLANIVCVQNLYNLAKRDDDDFIDELAAAGVAYVPFFPLGGFTPLQSSVLSEVAAAVHATPMQVALAWLLRRAPNILLIPGTSSVAHLRENVKAATLQLPQDMLERLNGIGRPET
jgi:pyridoxine 4-dehydrogenase